MNARALRIWVATALAGSVLAACASIGGCSSSGGGAGSTKDPATILRDGTGTDWVLDFHPVFKTVSFAVPKSGAVGLPGAGGSANALLALLDQYKDVFGMKSPTTEWVLLSTTPGDQGFTHFRFQQQTRGVPVFGSDWLAAVDASGQLTSMSGVYVPAVDAVDIHPTQTPDAVTAAVQADVRKRLPQLGAAAIQTKVDSRPVIYAAAGIAPALALYVSSEVNTATDPDKNDYLVDAHTAAILLRVPATVTEYAQGYGASHYAPYSISASSKVSFPVKANPTNTGAWYLDGTTKGAGVRIRTDFFGDSFSGGAISGGDKPGSTTQEPTDWTDSSNPKGAAVDAQANFAAVVDAYNDVYGRKSFDNASADITIHINDNSAGNVNAFWQANSGLLTRVFGGCSGGFGIGDADPQGTSGIGGAGNKIYPLGASIDVLAHEFTHGVTQCAWGGTTDPDTSGAVNEAMSDILGEFVSGNIEGGTPTLIGRNISPKYGYLRNLSDPHDANAWEPGQHCATVDELSTCAPPSGGYYTHEPHHASTIVSYAWFLMTAGGVHATTHQEVPCPLGWDASRKLWYDVETKDLHTGPDYKAVANATLAAGKRLKLPLDPIACAWVAVKVITAADAQKDWNVTCPGADAGASDAGASDASAGDGGGLVIPGTISLLCSGTTGLNH